jgi:hypothetical protein
MTRKKTENKELLVALFPKKSALDILKNEGWYHIPVETAPQKRWPPKVMAFYQGAVFGVEERYKIRYFAEVGNIDIVPRKVLFPDDEENKHKGDNLYYLSLERKIAHRKCAIEQNLKNRKANTNYGLATGDLNAFLLLKITG